MLDPSRVAWQTPMAAEEVQIIEFIGLLNPFKQGRWLQSNRT